MYIARLYNVIDGRRWHWMVITINHMIIPYNKSHWIKRHKDTKFCFEDTLAISISLVDTNEVIIYITTRS